jgi:uncharacterized membrane protein (GlpM family)
MLIELLLRFLIGGAVVSLFAVLGDTVKPESLGGIFAAAPTIALATVALTLHERGAGYVALEARSMMAGAAAFFVYACAVSWVMMRRRTNALPTATVLLLAWAGVAATLWAVWLRG